VSVGKNINLYLGELARAETRNLYEEHFDAKTVRKSWKACIILARIF